MKTIKLLLCTFLLSGTGLIELQAQVSPTDLVPLGSSVKKLSSNQYIFTEGPVWYNDSVMLFVDDGLGAPDIYQFEPVGKKFSKWPTNSSHCLGLTCDKDGNLIACTTDIIMMNKGGAVIETPATKYMDKKFNGPNDVIADATKGIYFTDPVFFVTPIQDKEAVYYIDSTGIVTRVIDDLATPNGLVLSPDGLKLYVVDSDSANFYSWNVAPNGSVSGKLKIATLQTTGGIASGADGMAIDIQGNIYITSERGIQIFSPQGDSITIIDVPEIPSNCDFGGKDFKTLYITAHKNLYSIDLNFPGYAVSRSVWPASVRSIQDKQSIDMYPNPVQNVLHIDLPVKAGTLEIFDISGKSVIQKEIRENNPAIDVSGLGKGIYFVKEYSGKQTLTGKFVKY